MVTLTCVHWMRKVKLYSRCPGRFDCTWFINEHPGATILHDLRISRAFVEDLQSIVQRQYAVALGMHLLTCDAGNNALFAAELSGHYYMLICIIRHGCGH